MTTPSKTRLIVGLGNPGPRYHKTRHNAGFLVVEELARRWDAGFRRGRSAEEARHGPVTLLKPTTFMNVSGQAVQGYQTRLGLKAQDILLVHDDLDLPLGRLRIKSGGGAGGQRGVADTIARIGPDFLRLKVGIGRPPEGWETHNWVLSRFVEAEQPLLAQVVAAAADAVEALLAEGLDVAMGRYNGLELSIIP